MSNPTHILGISFDAKSSFMRGAAQAPGRIRNELLSSAYNPFAESMREVLSPDWSTFEGIITPGSFQDIAPMTRERLKKNERYLFIGGDHAISYPLLQAQTELHGNLHILHFDAHGDLYDSLEGDRYSHACPFARILEDGLALSLTQVGIRTMTPQQQKVADQHGAHVVPMRNYREFDPSKLSGPLYISLDIDVFDPAFAPGVSHREAGGLDARTLIDWLQEISVPIVGADIVEYNPLRDPSGITVSLCYKLVKEILDAMARNPLIDA